MSGKNFLKLLETYEVNYEAGGKVINVIGRGS